GSLVSAGESFRKKIIGKPYSGKPNVRFDEGELEIEQSTTTPALYSTGREISTFFNNTLSNQTQLRTDYHPHSL
ncbi:MAG: hypothetical protein NT072_07330, partial [Deltaproteobacteria bacterium]|nr:hypothetical protein [Deltaproteobacteria bacterium]